MLQAVLFNPRLLPSSSIPKPQEEDFQDAKLLYYYPQEELKDQKRNVVGLIEGNLLFYKDLNPELRRRRDERLLLDEQDLFVMYSDQLV